MAWRFRQRPLVVPVQLPPALAAEVDQLLNEDKFIDAVRLVRVRTALTLYPATLAVVARRGALR